MQWKKKENRKQYDDCFLKDNKEMYRMKIEYMRDKMKVDKIFSKFMPSMLNIKTLGFI